MLKFFKWLALLLLLSVVLEGTGFLFNNFIFMISPLMMFALAVIFVPIFTIGFLSFKVFHFFQKRQVA
ncbi:hypothetical protein CSV77_15455 [Sporosarcina sp. P16b]|uniref:hypothetical protein n=1 Tax=Sporosarcina sp. P16b TaxID=2048261 RepID=UPI000C167748|nr:hypothetical protein [Sporosarcina sp. P16b]PIC69086.1 hypothetical protein CSV77_15455 [Sporosarcina sp. P16b]